MDMPEFVFDTITPAQVVESALAWDLSKPIAFLVNRKGMDPSYAAELATEYLRFIGILAENRERDLPVSEAVDEMWHTHILFTEDYRRMGDEVYGGYINHHPVLTETERVALIPRYLEGTLANYQRLYGTVPDEKWWARSGAICFSKGPGLNG